MALEEKLYQYLDRLKVRYPLVAFIVDVIEVYLDRRVSRSSAELAYYLLLSVFPCSSWSFPPWAGCTWTPIQSSAS